MINTNGIKLDHVGWITNDIHKFESFWCSLLGFVKIGESTLHRVMSKELFGIDEDAAIYKYKLNDICIEIHVFKNPEYASSKFNRNGINHICLFVNNREEFIAELPINVPMHIYHNPKGWKNIFMQDYENNWIELREYLK